MNSIRFSTAFFVLTMCFASTTLLAAEGDVLVDVTTNAGVIRLELYPTKAPKTVENFLAYAKSGHFEGTVFHRVISDFMIQGGGMAADLKEKSTEPPIVNESANGLKNVKYSVAMARTSEPHSATSQFFINTGDNAFLDKANAQDGVGYAVFGRVTTGQEVVDKISAVKTTTKRDPASGAPMADVPVEPITIISVKVVE